MTLESKLENQPELVEVELASPEVAPSEVVTISSLFFPSVVPVGVSSAALNMAEAVSEELETALEVEVELGATLEVETGPEATSEEDAASAFFFPPKMLSRSRFLI